MMLCRVTLGHIYRMEGTNVKAHERMVGSVYDSLVGITPVTSKFAGSREFVVYDTDLVYPEYIMWYK